MPSPSFDPRQLLRDRAAMRRVGVVAIACATVGLLYGLFAPRWYRSLVTVVPSKQQRSGFAGALTGDLGSLASLADVSSTPQATAARIAAVLQSVSVTDAVIDKFDLRQRYGERYQETAREALWRHCEVKALPKPGLVQLSCEDKDPRFVQEMLAFFADYGNQVFRRVGVSSAAEEVRFLEKHVTELRQQADASAERMRAFQEEHQIVDLETQSKAVVSALASLNNQRIAKQLELDYARTFSARDEATLQQLRSQLSVMDDQVLALEQAQGGTAGSRERGKAGKRAAGTGLFPAALAVPKLRAQYEILYRDRKVAETSLVFALERLEDARATEARDVSTFLVLDPPALPTRKSRPKGSLSVLAGLVAGLALGVAVEWWRRGGRATVLGARPAEQERRTHAA
jgi:capsule polysaccharide export protein KpsE/RkpR